MICKAGAAAGWLWDGEAGQFYSGWVSWNEGGRVLEVGRGRPPARLTVNVWGVILPPLVNHHTHVGDAAFRARLEEPVAQAGMGGGLKLAEAARSAAEARPSLAEAASPDRREGLRERTPKVAEVVGPGGLKHRWLAEAAPGKLVGGMELALGELAEGGCNTLLDFREGGREGVALLKMALGGVDPARRPAEALILGRPDEGEPSGAELRALLACCDGLGLSALADYPEGVPLEWAREAHRAGKLVTLHASEAEREPMEQILELKPHLLVHLGAASQDDLDLVAQAQDERWGGPMVALCPKSNLRFSLRPAAAPRLLELGVPLGLGTDNAMLGPGSLLDELRLAARLWPQLREAGLMSLLLGAPKWLNKPPGYPPTEAEPAGLTVWNGSGTRPLAKLLAPDCSCRLRVFAH